MAINSSFATRSTAAATSSHSGTSGSQTILQTDNPQRGALGTLRLRARPSESRHIQWAESVVDNEGMGKKSSKVCCIYHKPHEPGDSDSESSSSSSDDDSNSDSEPDLSRAQRAGGKRNKKGRARHNHKDDSDKDASGKGKERKPSPNAYERQPKSKIKRES